MAKPATTRIHAPKTTPARAAFAKPERPSTALRPMTATGKASAAWWMEPVRTPFSPMGRPAKREPAWRAPAPTSAARAAPVARVVPLVRAVRAVRLAREAAERAGPLRVPLALEERRRRRVARAKAVPTPTGP